MKKLNILIIALLFGILGNAQTFTKKNVSTNGSGWKRIAYCVNNVGRGYSKVTILTLGGTTAPHVTEFGWFKGWSNYGGINVISNNRASYWTDCRITFDGMQSYLEVKFTTDIPLLEICLDQKEWTGTNLYSSPLPDGGGTVIASARIGRINLGEDDFMLSYSGNVGIGTSAPTAKLEVNGTIKATEIKVEAQTADFVFEEDYQLKSLTEVEQFIQTNNHLPDIPSAKEMKEDGVGLAEMNKLLLRKVEELTLYSIEMEKARKKEQSERENLREEMKFMKSELQTIKKIVSNK